MTLRERAKFQSKAMQLSTNRVNFTNSTVAQFNYVEFLSQFRSRRRGTHNYGNILRLHNDDVAFSAVETESSTKIKFQHVLSKCLKYKRALVLYVPPKNLTSNIPKSSQWYRYVIFVLYKRNQIILVQCNLKMLSIEIQVYLRSKTTVLCTINVTNGVTKGSVYTSTYRLHYHCIHK